MNVCVVLNHHFRRTPDGRVWAQTMFPYSFWCRYLEVFERVQVISRVRSADRPDGDWVRADGDGVEFRGLPDFTGPYQYVRRRNAVRRAIRSKFAVDAAYVLRIPSIVSTMVWRELLRRHLPYGVEVVGDPWDGYAPGTFSHWMLPWFRRLFTHGQRQQCAQAAAAAYVTSRALQDRYPCLPQKGSRHRDPLCISYSSVDLPADAYVDKSRTFDNASPQRIIFVGSIDHYKKAPEILVQAVGRLCRAGHAIHLTIVGGGRHQGSLLSLAKESGCGDQVHFTGQLTAGPAVRVELDRADLFVLPSRHEGLPRAMLEAMARGLPCIGTRVGGIPEILGDDALVPPGNPAVLACKIAEFIAAPERLNRASQRNLEIARDYARDVLQQRRVAFFRFLAEVTQESMPPPQAGHAVVHST